MAYGVTVKCRIKHKCGQLFDSNGRSVLSWKNRFTGGRSLVSDIPIRTYAMAFGISTNALVRRGGTGWKTVIPVSVSYRVISAPCIHVSPPSHWTRFIMYYYYYYYYCSCNTLEVAWKRELFKLLSRFRRFKCSTTTAVPSAAGRSRPKLNNSFWRDVNRTHCLCTRVLTPLDHPSSRAATAPG